MRHFDYLLAHVHDLSTRKILDLGSGRGNFLLDALSRGVSIVGLEPNPHYRATTLERGAAQQLTPHVEAGLAEALPFPDNSFDFVNMNEVVEHVDDPLQALREVARVLTPRGAAYVSIPNRFGFCDPHYHLIGINWLPRPWAERIITYLGKGKPKARWSGAQRLSDMHYATFSQATALLREAGFEPLDVREKRIRRSIPTVFMFFALFTYHIFRFCYFDTFHFIVKKS